MHPPLLTLLILHLLIPNILTFRIITFNIEYGAESYSPETVSKIILDAHADIAILQETFTESGSDSSIPIASFLQWNRVSYPNNNVSVLANFTLETKEIFPHFSVVLVNQKHLVFGVHFDDWYYQPFQAAFLPYDRDGVFQPNTTDPDELVLYANQARGEDVTQIISMIGKYKELNFSMILAGDFNEPSHLDWTSKAFDEKLVPVSLKYPSTARLVEAGLRDVFRMMYMNEVDVAGYTWPDKEVDYPFRRDRIDFMFVNDVWLQEHPLDECFVVGHTPSDHAALVGGFK